MSPTPKQVIRCAVYTRKSSEEGLEQDFNSLDAQREACEAYVTSQKHEGWQCLPTLYDDGGYSGGTIKRPALRDLLIDVEQGRIDVVVVYKVDRLTRSLPDFAKIVDIFDAQGVSFVSVTQAFNTTSSMGRLTLNVLLSFAQFEREVTGERIRDKIAASKKKGMWMGGVTPLGYVVKDRKLVVALSEAETVRQIFRLYLELGSVRLLKEALNTQGTVTKIRVNKHGKQTGGKPFARGALYHLLQNRIYTGEIVHKLISHPGDHDAILDPQLWAAVQDQLALNRHEQRVGENDTSPSLLAGMIVDNEAGPLTPSHAVRRGKHYCYYVSKSLNQGESCVGIRVPAGDIDHFVSHRLRTFMSDPQSLHQSIEESISDASKQRVLLDNAIQLTARWQSLSVQNLRHLLLHLGTRVHLKPETVEITIDAARIVPLLKQNAIPSLISKPGQDHKQPLTFTVPAVLKRAGLGVKLHIEGDAPAPDISLIRLLVRANLFHQALLADKRLSIRQLGRQNGLGSSYVSRILRLHFLSPTIKRTIMDGRQPPELTARQIMLNSKYPLLWEDQHRQLGFASK